MQPLSNEDQPIKESIHEIWYEYNKIVNKLKTKLGRTANVVSDYSEHLASRYYCSKLQKNSKKCFDFLDEKGQKYQVKARRITDKKSTQLSVIRSWGFDFLVIILFDKNGLLIRALEVPVEVAKKHICNSKHQNGDVISTTERFMKDQVCEDITAQLQCIIDNDDLHS